MFVDILWNTGGRVSEALKVTSGRINFERSTIQSQRSKKRRGFSKKSNALRKEIRGLELALGPKGSRSVKL